MITLSLVIPTFNPDQDFPQRLTSLAEYLRPRLDTFEILVVNDASTNLFFQEHIEFPEEVKVLHILENKGKFGALKEGMSQSQGRCCIFTDADLPYDFSAITYICRIIIERDIHVVVGDRLLSESVYNANGHSLRLLFTRGFRFVVRTLITGGLFDTQCGIKGFRGDVARALFPLLREERFAGDVELLYVALKYNLEIKKIPVRLLRSGPTSVRLIRDTQQMLRALVRFRLAWGREDYKNQSLEVMASQRYWEAL